MRERRLVAGLDIGATKTLAVALDASDAVMASDRTPTPTDGADGIVATAVGVGIPGRVRPGDASVSHAVNLGLGGIVAVGPQIEDAVCVPTVVENDVNAAALGAAALLSPEVPADLAYISTGTGIAAGLILDGGLRRGQHGVAGRDRSSVCRSPRAEVRVRTVRAFGGGGVAEAGEALVRGVRGAVAAQAAKSPWLRSLDLERLVTAPPAGTPVCAIGAGLAARDRRR